MTATFNIIYTPGTVKQLSFFVWSLLKWTSATFRLVSNGCLPQEQQYLSKLCHQNSQLEYWSIPTNNILPHGQALNYLQAMTQDQYFCFMDSDIFVTGDFTAEIAEYKTDHAGIFSGMPIWVKSEEEVFPPGFRSMTGMFNRTSEGLPLGSTFFSIYNNQLLTELMQSTGIGFEEYRWSEIPTSVQNRINTLGLAIDIYDTSKVLNLLLLADNKKLINLNLASLCHIGGTSFQVFNNNQQNFKRKFIDKLPGEQIQNLIELCLECRAVAIFKKRYANAPEAEFQLNADQRIARRNPVRQYFLELLNALFQGKIPPASLITGDVETDNKIYQAREQLLALFEEHIDKLQSIQ